MKIGLEVHIYPRTRAKLFCECPVGEAAPNTAICPVCAGLPGAKPMLPNGSAVKAGLVLAKSLGCSLPGEARVLRKHYFYPDLPSGYQRTSTPLGEGGTLAGVRIREIHFEEDAGTFDPRSGEVDYNRAGTPLLELVTEPDMGSPEAARRFLNELSDLLSYLGVADSMKVDANISTTGERVEIKNINSVRNVETALRNEAARQEQASLAGRVIERETRHFDEFTGRTLHSREKETVEDYRYMPDPDLAAVDLPSVSVEVPEPLEEARAGLARRGIDAETARVVCRDRDALALFERLSTGLDPVFVAKWLRNDLLGELNYRGKTLREAGLDAEKARQLLLGLKAGSLTPNQATDALRALLDRKDARAAPTVSFAGLVEAVEKVLAANPKAVADLRSGKAGAMNFLVGEVSKATAHAAHPRQIIEAITASLR
jgi:aspartyl-tRNA(Asn)/glutamyl-tRNA(Gln) amidotransferase subunit B